MAIQFTCPACSQPIEIDDQYGGQQVVCPYCQGVVAAPRESRLEAAARPTAAPAARKAPGPPPPHATSPAPVATAAPAQAEWTPPPELARNRAGNLALAAGVLAWILFVAYVCYAGVVVWGLLPPEALEAADDNATATVELQRHLQDAAKRFAEDPALAGKRSVVAALSISSSGLGLLGVVLGIVGLTRKQVKKGTSIAALVISAPLLLCVFFAFVAGTLQAAGAAGAAG